MWRLRKNKMKKLMTIFGGILFASLILQGCATVKTSAINRPIDRPVSNFEVLGSVRLEILTLAALSLPYDQLLKLAHDKYGEMADVVEIKIEKQTIDYVERAKILKETKKSYSKKYVYNALVIKYLPNGNSTK
jgi:hypothetical protein